LLDELQAAGIATALATSAARDRTCDTLKHFVLDKRFSVVLTGADAKAKPRPDICLLAAAKLKVAADEALVIEDSVAGVEAAKAAGMRCVGYAAASDRIRLLQQAGADEVISAFTP